MVYAITLPNTRTQMLPGVLLGRDRRILQLFPSQLLHDPFPCKISQKRTICGQDGSQMDRHRRFFLSSRQRFQAAHHPPRRRHVYHLDDMQRRKPQWGWVSFKSSFPEFLGGSASNNNPWKAKATRAQDKFEWIKKEIDKDPYAALFGRRLEPFDSKDRLENGFASFLRSILGLGKDSNVTSGSRKVKVGSSITSDSRSRNPKAQESPPNRSVQSTRETDLEFDPISGRMIPKGFKSSDRANGQSHKDVKSPSTQNETCESHPGSAGSVSPLYSSVVPAGSPSPSDAMHSKDKVTLKDALDSVSPKSFHKNKEETIVQDMAAVVSETDQRHSDSLAKHAESSSETIHLGPPQYESQDMTCPRVPDSGGNSRDEQKQLQQESRVSEACETCVPEFSPEEGHEQKNLERLGFLSKSGQAHTRSSDIDEAQQPVIKDDKDDDLDLLRASDIRASYATKWSGQEPETQEINKVSRGASELQNPPAEDRMSDRGHEENEKQSQSDPNALFSEYSGNPSVQTPTVPETQVQDRAFESTHVFQYPSFDSTVEVYRVLAYDSASLKVQEAETSSSIRPSSLEIQHPMEVLSRLNHPAKFLPFFAQMRTDGYEIISGGGDLLVFRKVFQNINNTEGRHQETVGKVGVKDGERSSSLHFKPSSVTPGPKNPSEKESTSGCSIPPPQKESRARKLLRRILISGVATAATCYAGWVVSEYFRTGGEGGMRIDGFTEFESERRQRERASNF